MLRRNRLGFRRSEVVMLLWCFTSLMVSQVDSMKLNADITARQESITVYTF